MSARTAPAACARVDELGHRRASARRAPARRRLELVRHLLGERAVAPVELGQRHEEALERVGGVADRRARSRASLEQRPVHRARTTASSSVLLGREVAAHRADADAGAASAMSSTCAFSPDARERRLGRHQHLLAVADRVGPARPSAGGAPGLGCKRSHDSDYSEDPEPRSTSFRPPTTPEECPMTPPDTGVGEPRLRPPLVGALGPVPQPAHRLRRQLVAERRDPDALARPARDRVAAAVGRRDLLARVRGPALHDRRARRPLRPQGRAAGRAGALRGRRGPRVAGRRAWTSSSRAAR